MPGCVTADTMLAFLSDGLTEADEDRVAAHLTTCATCRALADALSDDDELRREYRGSVIPHADRDQIATCVLLERLAGRDEQSGGSEAAGLLATTGEGPERRLGRFRLQRQLGAGGFGVVWLAHDETLNRDVALKLPRLPSLVDPKARDRFLREARATAALRHPNIVPVFEAGDADGLPYLATAYCAGPTLAEWIEGQRSPVRDQGSGLEKQASKGRRQETTDNGPQTTNNPVSTRTAAELVRQLADAVEHAHSAGILHRDIKPANVLLDSIRPTGPLPFTPMLTDFGLAKLLADADATQTATGLVLGTPRYMAPEQATGRSEAVGRATDVYSLGVLLYELLTGRAPFEGSDSADMLRRLVTDTPPRPRQLRRDVPRDLEAICLKCLEKDPGRRYANADDLSHDLQCFLQGDKTDARLRRPLTSIKSWYRSADRIRDASVLSSRAGPLGIVWILVSGVLERSSVVLPEFLFGAFGIALVLYLPAWCIGRMMSANGRFALAAGCWLGLLNSVYLAASLSFWTRGTVWTLLNVIPHRRQVWTTMAILGGGQGSYVLLAHLVVALVLMHSFIAARVASCAVIVRCSRVDQTVPDNPPVHR